MYPVISPALCTLCTSFAAEMTLTFSLLQIFKPTERYPHHGWDPSTDLEASIEETPLRRKSPKRSAKIKEIFPAAVFASVYKKQKKKNRLKSESSSFVQNHLGHNIKVDQEAPYMDGCRIAAFETVLFSENREQLLRLSLLEQTIVHCKSSAQFGTQLLALKLSAAQSQHWSMQKEGWDFERRPVSLVRDTVLGALAKTHAAWEHFDGSTLVCSVFLESSTVVSRWHLVHLLRNASILSRRHHHKNTLAVIVPLDRAL